MRKFHKAVAALLFAYALSAVGVLVTNAHDHNSPHPSAQSLAHDHNRVE